MSQREDLATIPMVMEVRREFYDGVESYTYCLAWPQVDGEFAGQTVGPTIRVRVGTHPTVITPGELTDLGAFFGGTVQTALSKHKLLPGARQ